MLFYYAGRTRDGRRLEGSIDAATARAAALHLRARDVFVTTLEASASIAGIGAWLRVGLRGAGARPVFFRSFAALVGAGVSVRRALETIAAQNERDGFSETLASIGADIDEGASLSTAFSRHPREFNGIAVAMIQAGELAGALDGALRSLAELEERDRALRKRVAAALTYPCVVAVAAAALVAFLVAGTIPAFAAMFAQMRVPLPLSTKLLIRAAGLAHSPTLLAAVALVTVAAVAAMASYKTSDALWAATLDRWRLRLPLLGAIAAKTAIARFARTLGSLLRAGVDVVGALEAATGVVEGFVFRSGVGAIADALRRGDALAAPFEASRLFDTTFLALLRAGEESGSLDDMLLRIARYYELDVETALGALTSALEPLLICALGLAIGTIVASIIIPLYSMIGNIQ